MTTTRYAGWWEVPDNLMSATTLAELEFPRLPHDGEPDGLVAQDDGWHDVVKLFDVDRCPPSKATARQLEAAQRKSTRPRQCADCPARTLRPLVADVGRPLCPTCRQIALIRRAQEKAVERQTYSAKVIADAMGRPGTVLVSATEINPGPTDAGNRRPNVAAIIKALDVATGKSMLDLTMSLVGSKAKIKHEGAVPREEGKRLVLDAGLTGRPLLFWTLDEFTSLRMAAPSPNWPRAISYGDTPVLGLCEHSTMWRAQINRQRHTLVAHHPGALDRLLLHLQRIAATATPPEEACA